MEAQNEKRDSLTYAVEGYYLVQTYSSDSGDFRKQMRMFIGPYVERMCERDQGMATFITSKFVDQMSLADRRELLTNYELLKKKVKEHIRGPIVTHHDDGAQEGEEEKEKSPLVQEAPERMDYE